MSAPRRIETGVPHVTAFAWSPDGARFAVASAAGDLAFVSSAQATDPIGAGGAVFENPAFALAWSPCGRRLVAACGDGAHILSVSDSTASLPGRVAPHDAEAISVAWSPLGDLVATADQRNDLRLWDAETEMLVWRHSWGVPLSSIAWSPDQTHLAVIAGNQLCFARPGQSGELLRAAVLSEQRRVAWSPDGALLATAGEALCLWSVATGEMVAPPPGLFGALVDICFSTDGRQLAAATREGAILVWSLDAGTDAAIPVDWRWRRYAFRQAATIGARRAWVGRWGEGKPASDRHPETARAPAQPPEEQRATDRLAWSLAKLVALDIHPPLSLLRDLLLLLSGESVPQPLAPLMREQGVISLIELNWPAAAGVGLAAVLLKNAPLESWRPPSGLAHASAWQAPQQLAAALRGESAKELAPAPPLSALIRAARRIDDQMLTLLALVGPDEVARDPSLPLQLWRRAVDVPAMDVSRRVLLGQRVRVGGSPQTSGANLGVERGGVEIRGDFRWLMPSQHLFDNELFACRYHNRELLYHARLDEESPRLRPAVVVLDTSAASVGGVGELARLAAFLALRSLLEHGHEAALVFSDEPDWEPPLASTSDLLNVWGRRSYWPPDEAACFEQARRRCEQLQTTSNEPVILFLGQPWFAAERPLPTVSRLRALFAQYPGYRTPPRLAPACEKWRTLEPHEAAQLPDVLGLLLS